MKNVLCFCVTAMALISCSSGPKTIDYSSHFSSYKSGSNIETYCKEKVKAGDSVEECMYQLIIHDRSTKACAEAEDSQACMRLNANRWSYSVLLSSGTHSNLEYQSGKTIDQNLFHKHVLATASTFVLHCAKDTPCKNQY